MTLFWRKGFHATSLKDLERGLEMHPGSIYAAFQNKETLFRMALDRYFAGLRETLGGVVTSGDPVLPQLAHFLRDLHPVMRDDCPLPACFLSKTLSEMPVSSGDTTQCVADHVAGIETLFTDIFTEAVRRGELAPGTDPLRLSRRLQMLLNGISIYALTPAGLDVARDELGTIARRIEDLGAAGAEAVL
ncbi:MAG: TetR/AcrR family transcriptional regulator [Pseudomonadota bacterium]